MPETFTDDECYQIFIALDDRARQLIQPPKQLLELRERLIPYYEKIERKKLSLKE